MKVEQLLPERFPRETARTRINSAPDRSSIEILHEEIPKQLRLKLTLGVEPSHLFAGTLKVTLKNLKNLISSMEKTTV